MCVCVYTTVFNDRTGPEQAQPSLTTTRAPFPWQVAVALSAVALFVKGLKRTKLFSKFSAWSKQHHKFFDVELPEEEALKYNTCTHATACCSFWGAAT